MVRMCDQTRLNGTLKSPVHFAAYHNTCATTALCLSATSTPLAKLSIWVLIILRSCSSRSNLWRAWPCKASCYKNSEPAHTITILQEASKLAFLDTFLKSLPMLWLHFASHWGSEACWPKVSELKGRSELRRLCSDIFERALSESSKHEVTQWCLRALCIWESGVKQSGWGLTTSEEEVIKTPHESVE